MKIYLSNLFVTSALNEGKLNNKETNAKGYQRNQLWLHLPRKCKSKGVAKLYKIYSYILTRLRGNHGPRAPPLEVSLKFRNLRLYQLTRLNCTNEQPPQRGGAVPGPVWVGSKWLLAFPRVPVTPGTLLTQTIFSLCCPLSDRRRAAHSIFKIGRLFSLSLLSCPTLALLRLLILLLLLMSGNVHPNPGPIFPCSVCAGNVTWRGKSVQCCTCSKWVHLRCSQLPLSNFRALGSSHSWSCPPAVTL